MLENFKFLYGHFIKQSLFSLILNDHLKTNIHSIFLTSVITIDSDHVLGLLDEKYFTQMAELCCTRWENFRGELCPCSFSYQYSQ